MQISINIIGDGNVTGGGSYDVGQTAVVTAVPIGGFSFKHFEVGDFTTVENPLSVEVTELSQDMAITATFYVPIEDYLRGCVDFDITDSALTKIRVNRDVKFGQDISELSETTKELCYADILMWATTTASTIQSEKNSDNGWSYQAASKTLSINDKKRLEERAMQIYKLYKDPKASMNTNVIRYGAI